MTDSIQTFLASAAFAVAGASKDKNKFGNKVLRCYIQHKKRVYPVNPHETMLEGVPCVNKIADLPDDVESLSIVTPPPITEKIVEQAIKKGTIKNIWMQPGAESELAIRNCKMHHINVIANGPCLLVTLGC
ncbi:MAG: CoA-binding protein [Gammaproteobacteria bacterium]